MSDMQLALGPKDGTTAIVRWVTLPFDTGPFLCSLSVRIIETDQQSTQEQRDSLVGLMVEAFETPAIKVSREFSLDGLFGAFAMARYGADITGTELDRIRELVDTVLNGRNGLIAHFQKTGWSR